jgi:hypothetical protein
MLNRFPSFAAARAILLSQSLRVLPALSLAGCLSERMVRPPAHEPEPALPPAIAAAAAASHYTGVIPLILVGDSADEASADVAVGVRVRLLSAAAAKQSGTSAGDGKLHPTGPSFDLQESLVFITPPKAERYTQNVKSEVPYKLSWSCIVNGVNFGYIQAQVTSVTHYAVEGTGGHTGSHDSPKPHGASEPNEGITDADGFFVSKYTPGLASGDETQEVVWSAIGGPPECAGTGGTDVYDHATRVVGLVPQTNSADLVLAPITSHHSSVYYVTDAVRRMTLEAATSYRTNRKVALTITAQSLVYGGINDIHNNWAPSHFAHRLGTDVDMDGPADNPREWKQLMAAGTHAGFKRCQVDFQNHVHCFAELYPGM